MNRYFSFVFLVLIMFGMSSCSSEPKLELLSSKVAIVDDKDIAGWMVDENGKEFVPTALVYEFVIKNNGDKDIGMSDKEGENIEFYDENRIRIKPNKKLKGISEEIIGINIFEPDSYMETGLGYGTSTIALKSGEEQTFIMYYDLGISEENPYTSFITPPENKLIELQNYALDATMVIIVDNTEVAHFDLSK